MGAAVAFVGRRGFERMQHEAQTRAFCCYYRSLVITLSARGDVVHLRPHIGRGIRHVGSMRARKNEGSQGEDVWGGDVRERVKNTNASGFAIHGKCLSLYSFRGLCYFACEWHVVMLQLGRQTKRTPDCLALTCGPLSVCPALQGSCSTMHSMLRLTIANERTKRFHRFKQPEIIKEIITVPQPQCIIQMYTTDWKSGTSQFPCSRR